ncbi:MAG: DALR anticodon-binding domain-containing protein [Actinomycetota bacterium]|nr:DALR anticodon-binding domain-containing protein [Actinomycetota bacterium]
MVPGRLRELLLQVALEAADDGSLPPQAHAGPPDGVLFRPVDGRSAGVVADWVSPVATRWAPFLGLEPRALAQVLARGLVERVEVDAVEVTPSGLMAVTLTDPCRAQILEMILADEHYGCGHEADDAGTCDRSTVASDLALQGDSLRLVQLAHARLCRVVRNAEAVGVSTRAVDDRGTLTHVSERLLQVALADLPQRLDAAAGDLARAVRALTDLAELSDACDRPARPAVVGDDITAEHGVRLALARATARVLRNGLLRLNVDAPERM